MDAQGHSAAIGDQNFFKHVGTPDQSHHDQRFAEFNRLAIADQYSADRSRTRCRDRVHGFHLASMIKSDWPSATRLPIVTNGAAPGCGARYRANHGRGDRAWGFGR